MNRIVFDPGAFREILKSSQMASLVEGEAARIASSANAMSRSGGYSHDVKQMSTRVVASAYTDSFAAVRDNGKRQTLLRALGGG